MDGSLFERGKALEDRFFDEKDKQLLAQLKQEISEKENRDALSSISGISDSDVLDALIKCKVTAESLTSLSLVPLVAVAWADGVMEDKEREAILQAAQESGIEQGSASHKLLENWLIQEPAEDLLESWKEYVAALKTTVEEAAFGQLKSTVIGRARQVAESAGGFLGIGKTSDKESAVIDELETAFS